MEMDIILIEGGRQFGESIILLPGWKKDPTWTKPAKIHADISESLNPLEQAFQMALNAADNSVNAKSNTP